MMDGLCLQCLQEDRALKKDEEETVEEGGMNRSSPLNLTTDEETDEDSEPEPPPVARRKVSFADAFGLDLVSVKEFDNADVSRSEVTGCTGRERRHTLEEFYMSCLFSVPSSQAELDERLQTQMVELESIELLPGTTTIRGIIRVVNLCYNKRIYTRVTLDQWSSYVDLLAEYVPGSSDRRTDRFTFTYTLIPPFERDGSRVEFCLRYETSLGIFWANNKEMNYVLFCHQRGCIKEAQMHEESGFRSKRSCLRALRNGGAEEKNRGTITKETVAGEHEEQRKKEKTDKKTRIQKGVRSLLNRRDCKSMMENVIQQQNVEHLAHAQDCLPQSLHRVPRTVDHIVANGHEAMNSLPASQKDKTSSLCKSPNRPQVLTDHQTSLLTQDWNNDLQPLKTPDMQDIFTVNDKWDTIPKNTQNGNNKDSFLNVQRSEVHSTATGSGLHQTATNINDHQIQYTATTQKFQTFQVAADTPTPLHAHTLATCQGLSDTCKIQLANVTFNTKDHQSAKVCDSRPRDDNAATQDASQRSRAHSVIDTLLECSPKGAPPVSAGSVDSSTECHMSTVWEQEKDRIIGGEAKKGDEPLTLHTADLVTSSGESETTDMTAMLESQNATAGDRISVAARLREGLSSRGKGKVTGTAYNEMDDMLAFRETIRQETKDGARNVFSASRHGVEKEVEIFTPPKNEKSQGYLAEMCSEKFKYEQNTSQERMKSKFEVHSTLPHPSEFHTNKKCMTNEVSLAFNVRNSVNYNAVEVFNREASEETVISRCSDLEITCQSKLSGQQMLEALLPNQSKLFQANEEQCIQNREASVLTHIQESDALQSELNNHEVTSSNIKCMSCDEIVMNSQEFDPSCQVFMTKSKEMVSVVQCHHCERRSSLTDDPNFFEILQPEWSHLQEERTKKNKDGDDMSTEEAMLKKSISEKHLTETSYPGKDLKNKEKDESVSRGKLNREPMGELMVNVKDSQEETGNARAELNEHKLSAEDEISSPVEYERISGGAKYAITSENQFSLEAIEPRLEKFSFKRFGEDLIRRIWKEVFSQELHASCIDTMPGNGVRSRHVNVAQAEENVNDTFDSGVYSLTTDLNSSLCQGQEKPSGTNRCECPSKERSQSFSQQIHHSPQQETDLNSSAHLSEDLSISFAFQRRRPLTKTVLALGSRKDLESCPTMLEKSDTCNETRQQKEIFLNESLNPSPHKHSGASLGNSKQSEALAWRRVLYIVFHIIRFLLCALLVGGFFAIVFLYDFSVFVSLYIFSLCWWIYVWKRHRVPDKKANGGAM